MRSELHAGLLGKFVSACLIAALLSGCNGSSVDTASNNVNTSASSSSSSSGGTSSSGSAPAASSDTVTLSWVAPTDNTDGSALTNLTGYNIYYGTSASGMTTKISIPTVGMLTYVISNLNPGTWDFTVTSVNSSGMESSASATVSATI
jgi:hypothetical protein